MSTIRLPGGWLMVGDRGFVLRIGRTAVRWRPSDYVPLYSVRMGITRWHEIGRLGIRRVPTA